jgi:hypothetical protein
VVDHTCSMVVARKEPVDHRVPVGPVHMLHTDCFVAVKELAHIDPQPKEEQHRTGWEVADDPVARRKGWAVGAALAVRRRDWVAAFVQEEHHRDSVAALVQAEHHRDWVDACLARELHRDSETAVVQVGQQLYRTDWVGQRRTDWTLDQGAEHRMDSLPQQVAVAAAAARHRDLVPVRRRDWIPSSAAAPRHRRKTVPGWLHTGLQLEPWAAAHRTDCSWEPQDHRGLEVAATPMNHE